MKRLSIFEITLAGMILGIAVAAKYFDRFIPHVHPFHFVVLLIGLSIMRFRVSIVLIISYIIVKIILFGPEGITGFMITFHILSTASLLLVSTVRLFSKRMGGKYKSWVIIPIIIGTMVIALIFKIIGDSDYSLDKGLSFFERVRLALIYPGDWLDATIGTALSIVIVPIAYSVFENLIKQHLDKAVW